MTRVSLIIVTRNRAEHLRQTLEAITQLPLPEDISVELIVADNGGTDHTAQVAREAHSARMPVSYFCEPKPGKANAINGALAVAQGEILLWADDDVRPPQNWIGAMCEPILAGRADGVAGKIRTAPHLERPWMVRSHYDRMSDTRFMPDDFGSMIGANMAFHRRVLEKVPAFDTELGAGTGRTAEETLFSFQMVKAGFKIEALPSVVIEHHFEPERLRRRVWLKVAEAYGRGEAYLRHHWEHVPVRFPFLQMLMWKAALGAFRIIRPPVDLDAEGCDRREMRLLQNVSFYQSYLLECRMPPKYDRHGLVKKTASERQDTSPRVRENSL